MAHMLMHPVAGERLAHLIVALASHVVEPHRCLLGRSFQ